MFLELTEYDGFSIVWIFFVFLRDRLQDCLQIRLTENKKKKIVTLLEKSEKYITTHTFIIFFIFFLLAASFYADIMIWKEGNGGQWSERGSTSSAPCMIVTQSQKW